MYSSMSWATGSSTSDLGRSCFEEYPYFYLSNYGSISDFIPLIIIRLFVCEGDYKSTVCVLGLVENISLMSCLLRALTRSSKSFNESFCVLKTAVLTSRLSCSISYLKCVSCSVKFFCSKAFNLFFSFSILYWTVASFSLNSVFSSSSYWLLC